MTTVSTQLSQAKHLDCIGLAAARIFQATCGANVERIAPDDDVQTGGVIVAVISLVGDVEWSIFLGLPRQTALGAASKFAGFDIPFESSDMGDAIGELTNILAGEVKALLNDRGVKVELSLPSVIRAQSIEVLVQKSVATNRECFGSGLGKFWTGVAQGRGAVFSVQ